MRYFSVFDVTKFHLILKPSRLFNLHDFMQVFIQHLVINA